MAQAQVIGILGAVVAGGLAYWKFKPDNSEETETTVVTPTTPTVTPTETKPLDNFTKKTGSLYPAMGSSNLYRGTKPDEPRAAYKTVEEAAAQCDSDENCIGFTHWPERYTTEHPKSPETPCSADTDCGSGKCVDNYCRSFNWGLSYFWTDSSAPNLPSDYKGSTWKSANGSLSLSQGVGPSHEYLDSRRPRGEAANHLEGDVEKDWKYAQHMSQKGVSYIKAGFEDFKYSDKFNDDGTAKTSESDNQTNEAEEVSAPVEYTPLSYQPASNSIQFDPKSRPDNCF
tara:strand:- start:5235 stop:6089 length:855 start_codon:yes stop_codon:yes gene_type:complete